MSTTSSLTPTMMPGPSATHFGTSWEIAVIVVIFVTAVAVIGTVMWQIQRRRRRRSQAQLATEEGRSEGLQGGIRLAREGSFQRVDEVSESLAKPQPTLLPYRDSKALSSSSTSSPDYRSTHPQRYYWNP